MSDPIPTILYCPECGLQHIDGAENNLTGDAAWTNPPHRSHLCHGCGHIWRPADVPTNGVAQIETRGLKDSPVPVRAYPSLLAAVREAKAALEPFAHWADRCTRADDGDWVPSRVFDMADCRRARTALARLGELG